MADSTSNPIQLRRVTATDFPAILALNAESVAFLSPLELARLAQLDSAAAYHKVVCAGNNVVAFLLALREGTTYDSPNYQWFGKHYRHFLYIDRIVVARSAQGRRLGALLYDDLFTFARSEGLERITAEFDIDPPNPQSEVFHTRYGFTEVGQQLIAGGKKRVSLQIATLCD